MLYYFLYSFFVFVLQIIIFKFEYIKIFKYFKYTHISAYIYKIMPVLVRGRVRSHTSHMLRHPSACIHTKKHIIYTHIYTIIHIRLYGYTHTLIRLHSYIFRKIYNTHMNGIDHILITTFN